MQVPILSVAVVEFGMHTPRYWSETLHGVSMECWKTCLILTVFDLLLWNFLGTQLKDIIVDNIFKKEVISTCNFTTNSDFVCFIIHSKGNLSLRGVTWNSRNWPIRCQNSNLWHHCDRQNKTWLDTFYVYHNSSRSTLVRFHCLAHQCNLSSIKWHVRPCESFGLYLVSESHKRSILIRYLTKMFFVMN